MPRERMRARLLRWLTAVVKIRTEEADQYIALFVLSPHHAS